MEKDIGKIKKNDETEIVIRIDDFGGSTGLTIREFVKSERYTGFTKAGVRIKGDKFEDFKKMIDSISLSDFENSENVSSRAQVEPEATDDEDAGIDEQGLM